MLFNPSMPRNPIGGMSFTPGLPGQMPSPDRSRSPGPSDEPQIARGIPNQPGLEARYDPISGFRVPQQAPKQGGGFFAGLGDALKNAVPDTVKQKTAQLIDTVKENIDNPALRFLTPPSADNPVLGGGEGRPLRGSDKELIAWADRQSPERVADIQQRLDQVLRSYFIQLPGQQYPQYTTSYFPIEGGIAA
jgi:hypothetical protein